MTSKCCIVVAIAAAALTFGCGSPNPEDADDKFIADLSGDEYWNSVDRATAIAAGHDFCTAVIEANKNGRTGSDAVAAVLTRYGLESGPVLFGAAKRSYCPDVDLG